MSLTGMSYLPRRDDTISSYGVEAIYEYWNTDNGGANNPSVGGVQMINWNFCCVWNWDARPFPTFPIQGFNWEVPVRGWSTHTPTEAGVTPPIGHRAIGRRAGPLAAACCCLRRPRRRPRLRAAI